MEGKRRGKREAEQKRRREKWEREERREENRRRGEYSINNRIQVPTRIL